MSGRLRLLGQALIAAVIALVLYLCLLADRLVLGSGVLGSIMREVAATFRDAGSQWMVCLCLGVYFIVFNLVRLRLDDRCFWRPNNADLWLSGALGAGSFAYALDYLSAAASTQALTLLGGATLGQGMAVWMEWRRDNGTRYRFLFVLVALLVIGALWRPEVGRDFAYHGHARWTGPWNNPNIFGVLMGMGVVVAVGQLINRLRIADCGLRITGEMGKAEDGLGNAEDGSRRPSPSQAGLSVSGMPFSAWSAWSAGKRFIRIAELGRGKAWKEKLWEGLLVVFFLASAGVMSVGLLNSFSRGAWLATACGLVYLVWEVLRLSRVSRLRLWASRNRLALFTILLSVVVFIFWQLHQAEHTVVRRALSAGNVNDFSWRNRVAAWEGALQMMSDRPWLGFGWKQPERVYENFYRIPNFTESGAFSLNDHLMLGTTLGLPALLCFLVYMGLSLRRGEDGEGRAPGSTIRERDGLKISYRAGAIVLLIGFWFDGGLFNLATAAPFWILLELGQAQPQMNTDGKRLVLSADKRR